MPADEPVIEELFNKEYAKIVSVLCRTFGLRHVEIAEDIVSDSFLSATEVWRLKGVPENPRAWLYAVAKNKAKNHLTRTHVFDEKVSKSARLKVQKFYSFREIDLSEQNLVDSELEMMFAVCHPSIPLEAQIGLSLNLLCGFRVEEIADAFFARKETIYKRLLRAKEKLKAENILLEMPSGPEIEGRLESVLRTLYLVFNEGYYSASSNVSLRRDFCLQAMELTYLLVRNPNTNLPRVNALLALMCFHSSRFEARIDNMGQPKLYGDQDPDLWSQDLIDKGRLYMKAAMSGSTVSKYHFEAAIAYWHTIRDNPPEKWENILQLYNKLLQLEYSPVAALNRTYALARTGEKKLAIQEALKLNLSNNYLYFSLLGYLYTDVDNVEAIKSYSRALELAKSECDRASILRHIGSLSPSSVK